MMLQAFASTRSFCHRLLAYLPFGGMMLSSSSSVQTAAERNPFQGHLTLIGAGPGARDLLTLRAVERLKMADLILYDRLVDRGVLELADPKAEHVFVGKEVGACAWPQERICQLIIDASTQGRRVVRLKSGDPSIFGRATEEVQAARQAGVPVEIVPGVTAASAAAASMGVSLTERGQTDAVVLVTGTCRPGDPSPDWAHHVRPGTTLAIYMGVGSAERIACELMCFGAAATTEVDIAVEVSTPRERMLHTTLCQLKETLDLNGVRGVALIVMRFPKSFHPPMAIAAE